MSALSLVHAFLVEHGPGTAPMVASGIGLSVKATAKALMNLRQQALVTPMGRVPRTPGSKGRGNTPMLWGALEAAAPTQASLSILDSALRSQPALATAWLSRPSGSLTQEQA